MSYFLASEGRKIDLLYVPIVQWIERKLAELEIEVRILVGTQNITKYLAI